MLNRSHSKILIMTAVDAEQQAVLRGLDGYEGADVQLAGVGPASAAASTATADRNASAQRTSATNH
ncbi:hypothetical protein RW092_21560 [Paenibacillus sp. 3LSP]|uniref:hypothetical protein n=1 Tax=Paenibacillus sp. 3LSP TaxID=2800795 RepID=UPI0028FD0C7A|nr:hypothetical protein [Paenibacillus sp. 3LSP]MDU0332760.1 hypothetical protein [Paenibacillus sp. 3LSP]